MVGGRGATSWNPFLGTTDTMKKTTFISQHAGSYPAIIQLAGSGCDIDALPVIKDMSMGEASELAAETFSQTAHQVMHVDGTVVHVDARIMFKLVLFSVCDRTSLDGLRLLVIGKRADKFRAAYGIVVKRTDGGWWKELSQEMVPTPVIPLPTFVDACTSAVRHGRILMKKTFDKRCGSSTCSQRRYLQNYSLLVTIAGITHHIRLDMALALLKRGRKLPLDAYGDEVLGITESFGGSPDHVSQTGRYGWAITYAISDDHTTVKKVDTGNIDHVFPQAMGGRTRLCNLQVMRMFYNSSKGDVLMPDVSGEPMISARMILLLRHGVKEAYACGRINDVVYDGLTYVIRKELSACAEAVLSMRHQSAMTRTKGRAVVVMPSDAIVQTQAPVAAIE